MDNRVQTLIFFIFFLYFLVPKTFSQTINEICPVSSSQHQYEWVEVYNNTDNVISTSNLTITDSTNKMLQWQAQEISPHGYVLATSSSVLNNSDGDNIIIKDQGGNTITSQSYSGSFVTDRSYARCNEGSNWVVTTITSPLSANDSSCLAATPTTTSLSSVATSDFTNIYISEVMVDPDEGGNEWVELFNSNNYEVNLIDWQIDDIKDQGASPYAFTTKIPPNSYGVIDVSKNMFNNDADLVRLLNYQGVEKNSIHYTMSQKNKTLGKTSIFLNEVCVQESTKNSPNGPCISIDDDNKTNVNTSKPSTTPLTTNTTFDSTTKPLDSQAKSSESSLLATQSAFSLPNLGGLIKGVTTSKYATSKPTDIPRGQKERLKTANSYAATSFMFAWANICYILFKIRKKYLRYYEQNFS